MHKVACGAWVIGLLVACGGGSDKKTKTDAGSNVEACDPIKQTGCDTSEKCTWIYNSASAGTVGCEPNGSVTLGGACLVGSGGAPTYPEFDNCEAGNICLSGKCESICDPTIGSGACGTGFACMQNPPLFTTNGTTTAGACTTLCDPLADNRFGSGGPGDPIAPKTGAACADGEGCYGFPSVTPGAPTQFTCMAEMNPTLVHRSDCTTDDGCAPDANSFYLDGCAQGYLPLSYDVDGGATVLLCVALCEPQDCYSGHCGSDNLAAMGSGTHQCASADVRTEPGTNGSAYAFPTTGNGGDPYANSCYYWWQTEFDGQGTQHPSQYDNTLGICIDHTKIYFDPAGGMDPTTPWPDCSTVPGSGSGGPGGTNAADWGCISTTTATSLGDGFRGVGTDGAVINRPRLSNHALKQLMRTRQAR